MVILSNSPPSKKDGNGCPSPKNDGNPTGLVAPVELTKSQGSVNSDLACRKSVDAPRVSVMFVSCNPNSSMQKNVKNLGNLGKYDRTNILPAHFSASFLGLWDTIVLWKYPQSDWIQSQTDGFSSKSRGRENCILTLQVRKHLGDTPLTLSRQTKHICSTVFFRAGCQPLKPLSKSHPPVLKLVAFWRILRSQMVVPCWINYRDESWFVLKMCYYHHLEKISLDDSISSEPTFFLGSSMSWTWMSA